MLFHPARVYVCLCVCVSILENNLLLSFSTWRDYFMCISFIYQISNAIVVCSAAVDICLLLLLLLQLLIQEIYLLYLKYIYLFKLNSFCIFFCLTFCIRVRRYIQVLWSKLKMKHKLFLSFSLKYSQLFAIFFCMMNTKWV